MKKILKCNRIVLHIVPILHFEFQKSKFYEPNIF